MRQNSMILERLEFRTLALKRTQSSIETKQTYKNIRNSQSSRKWEIQESDRNQEK
jgi:hypothetical protein